MLVPLVLLFVAVPIVELAVILQVGREIGVAPTIAILIADSILGSVLMRAQGRAAWRRFAAATRAGRPPAREVIDGALIIAGGALLLTPGFLTDILGLALLLPPTRALVRRVLARRLAHRMVVSLSGGGRGSRRPPFPPGGPRPGSRAYDLDGTATDSDPDRPG